MAVIPPFGVLLFQQAKNFQCFLPVAERSPETSESHHSPMAFSARLSNSGDQIKLKFCQAVVSPALLC